MDFYINCGKLEGATMRTWAEMGLKIPAILLPNSEVDLTKWAVVACDQYTSEPEYWEAVEKLVGDEPSTLHLILPEIYLESTDAEERIKNVQENMLAYDKNRILTELDAGAILVTRQVDEKIRYGLVLAIDLEAYDYSADSRSLIRPTEGTIVERIIPRQRIRENASLELPHILLLLDDPEKTVIEPLLKEHEHPILYDIELMKKGGHVCGAYISENHLEDVRQALSCLLDQKSLQEHPILFASGDGNHSLATAKAHWEKVKATLSEKEKQEHPARYALVEIENVHDEGIVFEPIHRVLFTKDTEALSTMIDILQKQNPKSTVRLVHQRDGQNDGQLIAYSNSKEKGYIVIDQPEHQLEVGTLQRALDEYVQQHSETSIDYIHGEEVVEALSKNSENIGFLLPALDKNRLFISVQKDGPLPRKTFSMGEANEKRFYMECRRIIK